MNSDKSGPDDFASTHWSLVLAAGRQSRSESAQALAALCGAYWYPLYAYARRRFADIATAQDHTQEFFARLLEKNLLAVADPQRGRFRSFLLTAFKNFLANEAEKSHAQKRGGGQMPLPLDFQAGDARFELEPKHTWTPERLFDRQWALTLLEHVMQELRAEYAEADKVLLCERLKGALAGEADTSYAAIAVELGMTEGAVKQAAHRLRQRYREILRRQIAQTVADQAEIDDEIRRLFEALAP